MYKELFENIAGERVMRLELTADDLMTVMQNVAKETADAIIKDRNEKPSTELIPRKEAMKMLNVKTTLTMMRWEEKGYLQPHRISSRIFYKKGEVLAAATRLKRVID
ncbi:hypothetical protein ACUNWD_04645 [Sunxiuqinia sp. A32]|uniref:hypothetical protein n=1 Tax=Sunxiuqinia sp. A32 TaxID=3461496 RepID=UPI0040464956